MECNYNNELYHYGVPGMKWGIIRYRRKDGTLTPAGKRKVAKMKEQYTALTGKRLIRKPTPKSIQNQNKSKSIKNMTDEELDSKIYRLQKESQLYSLQRNSASKGRKFVSTVGRKVIVPAAIDAGKKVLTQLFTKMGKEALKINTNKSNKPKNTNKSMFNELEQEVKALEINNRKLKAEREYQYLLSDMSVTNTKRRKKKNTKYSDGLLDDLLK